MKTLMAFVMVGAAAVGMAEPQPELVVGVTSDIHVYAGDTGKSTKDKAKWVKCLRYFDSLKVDAVLVAGDLADQGFREDLALVKRGWTEVFGEGNRRSDGAEVVPLWIYGDHDVGGYLYDKNHKYDRFYARVSKALPEKIRDAASYEDFMYERSMFYPVGSKKDAPAHLESFWQTYVGGKYEPFRAIKVKGHTFILEHFGAASRWEREHHEKISLANFVAAHIRDKDEPFFFVGHRTPFGFLPHKDSDKAATEALKGYRNAIAFSGHHHYSYYYDHVYMPREKTAAGFTCVSVPALRYVGTPRDGNYGAIPAPRTSVKDPEATQCLLVKVFADGTVRIERHDFGRGAHAKTRDGSAELPDWQWAPVGKGAVPAAVVPDLAIHTAANGNRYAEGMLRGKDGVGIYTYAALPKAGEKRPVVVSRCPYIRNPDRSDNTNRVDVAKLSNGVGQYITVCQHCRGRGVSEGDFRPYVDEREDGLALLEWIRQQDFCDGRILLTGGSYCATVHWAYLADRPEGVVGAALTIQTPDWYCPAFRNGMFKTGLHGGWYQGNAHAKDLTLKRDKSVKLTDFPLIDWSRRYYGKADPVCDSFLQHPRRDDPYWSKTSTERFAGATARRALDDSTIPVMMKTGFYDIYTEDVFDQWRGMSPKRRANCTLIVDAYGHGGKPESWMAGTKADFPGGEREHFGKAEGEFRAWCLDTSKAPNFTGFKLGHTTYYALWENKWYTEPELANGPRRFEVRLSAATNAAEVGWTYDPRRGCPYFPGSGGICFGGMQLQRVPNFDPSVRTFILPPLKERLDVRGRMSAEFSVKSDCEDTCFYVRVSVDKGDGKWYLLRDDIKPLTYDDGAYTPGSVRKLRFGFADHAYRLEPGDVLRVDVSSGASCFQPHPNVPGNPSLARETRVAHNAILPAECVIAFPCK